MLTLEEIISKLQDRNITVVAGVTGIHYNTLRAIRDGKNDNPTYKVMVKLSEYFNDDI